MLAVVAGAGVGALLVLVSRGSPAPAPAWSAWEPTGSLDSRAAQIAEHVSDPYRLPSGRPLVGVKTGPPTATFEDGTTFVVSAIAVQPGASSASTEKDIDTFDASRTVMYTLCGAGRGCLIPEGAPSAAREQLLRREALELALYSFTYLDGIDTTLVLFPPRAPDKAATAVFLQRSEVQAELGRPLSDTLTAPLAPGVGEIAIDEQQAIEQATERTTIGAREAVLEAAKALSAVDGVTRIGAIEAAAGSDYDLALFFMLSDSGALEPFGTDPRYVRFLQGTVAPVLKSFAGADVRLDAPLPVVEAYGACLALAAPPQTQKQTPEVVSDWKDQRFNSILASRIAANLFLRVSEFTLTVRVSGSTA